MTEGKTLTELDVKPGDVVISTDNGRSYSIHQASGLDWLDDNGGYLCRGPIWRIVSRAEPDTPKTWGPWTGWNGGECPVDSDAVVDVVWTNDPTGIPMDRTQAAASELMWGHSDMHSNIIAYRIKPPSPVRETATVGLGVYKSASGWKIHNITNPFSDCPHKLSITFTTIDGKPDCTSITMEAGDG